MSGFSLDSSLSIRFIVLLSTTTVDNIAGDERRRSRRRRNVKHDLVDDKCPVYIDAAKLGVIAVNDSVE